MQWEEVSTLVAAYHDEKDESDADPRGKYAYVLELGSPQMLLAGRRGPTAAGYASGIMKTSGRMSVQLPNSTKKSFEKQSVFNSPCLLCFM
jgi:hypothetical protein